MWGALLNFCGWALFCLAILLYVRGVCLELAHFSGQDPEAWDPDSGAEDGPWSPPDSTPSLRLPTAFSSENPASNPSWGRGEVAAKADADGLLCAALGAGGALRYCALADTQVRRAFESDVAPRARLELAT